MNLRRERRTAAIERAAMHAIEYVSAVQERRVAPDAATVNSLIAFDEQLPNSCSDPVDVIDFLHKNASPATVATTGGRFFGLVVGGATPAAMGSSMLATAWDQVAIAENVASAVLSIERVAARWVLKLLGLPEHASVGFTTGSSAANLSALAAARNDRYRRMGVSIERTGLAGAEPLKVLVSDQAHVTVHKALAILGFGESQIQRLRCNDQGQVLTSDLPELDERTILCLQAGNVNSGASDPFAEIIGIARRANAWVHVDGAFGLWAAASRHKRALVAGVEDADSWAVDAHKWLNTPYDCGMVICRHPAAVHAIMRTQAPYLEEGVRVAPKDMVVEFSRRARGVEVWAAIKEMGRDGIEDLVDRCCALASKLADGLKTMGFEILNDVVLNQVVATAGTAAQLQQMVTSVQQEGECWFGTTNWRGRSAIRLSVASWCTTDDDVDTTLHAIRKAAINAGIIR